MYIEYRLKLYTDELKSLNNDSSTGKEERHRHADGILLNVIRLLADRDGFGNIETTDIDELLKAYEGVPKWYS